MRPSIPLLLRPTTLPPVGRTLLLGSIVLSLSTIALGASAQPAPYPPPPPPAEAPPPDRTFGLYINPIEPIVGVYGGEFDYSPVPLVALGLNAAYLHPSLSTSGLPSSEFSASGYQLGLSAQFFPLSGRSFAGFYVRPALLFASISTTVPVIGGDGLSIDTVSATATELGVGATLGYQWAWSFGLSLRLGGGINYLAVVGNGHDSAGAASDVISYKGVVPALDLSLGWVF